jgi:hypothetical protein
VEGLRTSGSSPDTIVRTSTNSHANRLLFHSVAKLMKMPDAAAVPEVPRARNC